MAAVKITLFSLTFPILLFAAPSDDFIIKVKTDNPGASADTEFTIPIITTNGAGYNVNCDDSNPIIDATGQTGSYTCSYGSSGTYTIRIIDNNGDKKGFRRIKFGAGTDAEKLVDIQQWGTAIWSSMSSAFRDANHTTVSATDVPNLSSVGSLSSMFRNCTLADPDTSGWDISNITNLSYMFRDASSANPDVSQWDTSKVKKFQGMFYNALKANPDVSQWDTSSATRMDSMFKHALNADVNVSNWDTGSVTQMNYMFRDTNLSNPDVSRWDTTAVTNFRGMFYNATSADPSTTKNGNIWDTGNATNMIEMFRGASSANPDVGSWDVSSVTSLKGMFRDATAANPNVASWSTSNVTDMAYMFSGATSAYPDVSQWDTSLVTTFRAMFRGILSSPDVSQWDTSSATDMSYMFRDALNANPDVSNWDTSNVTNMTSLFYNAASADMNVTNWDTSSVTNMSSLFRVASSANPDVDGWDTSSVTNMNDMFRDAVKFSGDVSGWNVSQLTTARRMFKGVTLSIEQYDALLNRWDAEALQNSVHFHAGYSCYLAEGTARDDMINSDGWSITDGGKCVPCGGASGTLQAMHWKVVSLPCDTGNNTISDLLSGTLGTYGDNEDWVMYEQLTHYSAHPTNDMRLMGANDTLRADRGYWIISASDVNWSVDTSLSGLSYTLVQAASNLGISSTVFDDVNLTVLPDSNSTNAKKVMLGNPYPKKMQLSDLYFSHAGSSYNPMSSDAASPNTDYIEATVYLYDHNGTSTANYMAVVPDTPGFSDRLEPLSGFWIKLKSGQSGSNKMTYPLEK